MIKKFFISAAIMALIVGLVWLGWFYVNDNNDNSVRLEPRDEIIKDKEETALEILDIKVLGLLRKIRFDTDGNFIEDVAYNICYSENPSGSLREDNEWGEHRWCDIEEFLEIQKNNIDFGEYDRECILRIKDENFQPFHFEQVFTIKDY